MTQDYKVKAGVCLFFACTLMARAEVQGVYYPEARWTTDHTVTANILEWGRPLTLKVCWEQPDKLVHKDNLSYPEREVVLQLGDVKKNIQTAVEAAWKKYANLDFKWINEEFGASCDIRIYLDHRINEGEDASHVLGHYTGIGVKSKTKAIRLNLLYFDPVEIRDFSDASKKYTSWKRPGVAEGVYEGISKTSATAEARQNMAQRIVNFVMVHEFGHALGIYHEQCYDPMAYGVKDGCDASLKSIMEPIGPYDPYSVMLYTSPKVASYDAEPSCGDVITIRTLYGVKEVPGDRKNHCRVGTNICRTITPMPKSGDDPIPANIPGGSCHMAEIDESVVGALPFEQISKTNISTIENTIVNVEKVELGFSDPPEPATVPIGNSCHEQNWISPAQGTDAPLVKVHPGNLVRVKIAFNGWKDYSYKVYATGNALGTLSKTPMIPIHNKDVSANEWTGIDFMYPVPQSFCTPGIGGACTPDKNWYLGFMLVRSRTFRDGPLPPITINNQCHTTRSVWVSEKIPHKVIVQELQPVTRTAEARFAILNASSSDAGPGHPDAIPGESHSLAWVHSDQVLSQSFELLLYDVKDSPKETPRATWAIGTYKKSPGTNTVWINLPETFAYPGGNPVKMKGWARIKGIGAISSTSKLTAYSPAFYIGAPAPQLFSLEPAEGDPGDMITVNGRFINAATTPVTVTYRGEQAEILERTEDYIRFLIPATRRSGNVQVSLDGIPSNPLKFQIWPRIESIVPEHPKAGEVAEIRGYGLTESGLATTILLGDESAQIHEASEGTIKFSLFNSCLYGPGPLRVTVGTASVSQIVTPTPIISTGTMDAGVPGQEVTVMGESFPGYAQVFLNGMTIPSVTQGYTAIHFTVPQGATTGELKVIIPAYQGQSQVESNSIHFTVGPKPTFLSNNYGLPSSVVEIGGYFGNSGSSRIVRIGQTQCPIVSSSSSQIKFTVPALANFPSGMISVEVDGLRTDFSPFTVLPVLDGLSQGFAEPGEEVRLRGSFSGNPIVLKAASTSITVIGTGTDGGKDFIAFCVGTDFSSVSLSVGVRRYLGIGEIPLGTLTVHARPVIAVLEPAYGSPGDNIALKGIHFTHGGPSPEVRFGGSLATVVSFSDETLIVTVPPGSDEDMVTVSRVEGADRIPSFALPFRYTPVLSSFKPGVAVRGGVLEIQGFNFSSSSNDLVYVGNALATVLSRTTTSFRVRISQRAVTGDMQVVSDGVASAKVPIKVVPNLTPMLSILLQ